MIKGSTESFIKFITSTSYKLTSAVKHGRMNDVRQLASESDEDSLNWALCYSCMFGHLECVKFFIENTSADVNWNQRQFHPLAYACYHNQYNVVKYLLSVDSINVNLPISSQPSMNSDNMTALHLACSQYFPDIACHLLTEVTDIDVNFVSSEGNTALHYAVWYNHSGWIQPYMGFDCNMKNVQAYITYKSEHGQINEQNNHGNTLLHVACDFRNTELVEMLLSYGADERITNDKMQTPADVAVKVKRNFISDMVAPGRAGYAEILNYRSYVNKILSHMSRGALALGMLLLVKQKHLSVKIRTFASTDTMYKYKRKYALLKMFLLIMSKHRHRY